MHLKYSEFPNFAEHSTKALLIFHSEESLIIFKPLRIENKFATVDRDCFVVLQGSTPLSIHDNMYQIATDLLLVTTPDDKHDFVDFEYKTVTHRLYYDKDEYAANSGVPPKAILSAGSLNDLCHLSINKDEIPDNTIIRLTPAEIQSGLNRQKFAEGLIQQLPVDHDGRCTWLLNYGVGQEAQALRENRGIKFNELTNSAETAK